jgi:hypothetical protein
MVKFLVDSGANINDLEDWGKTALHLGKIKILIFNLVLILLLYF